MVDRILEAYAAVTGDAGKSLLVRATIRDGYDSHRSDRVYRN